MQPITNCRGRRLPGCEGIRRAGFAMDQIRPEWCRGGHDAAAAVQAANSMVGNRHLVLPADTAWTPAQDYGVYRSPLRCPLSAMKKFRLCSQTAKKRPS